MAIRIRTAIIFLIVALLYVGPGLLPGRTFAPLDLPLDAGAWKADPTQRARVSNALLGDVIVQFIPWDHEIVRLFSQGEMPWVNRFAGDGGPLFANPQTALFSPFTWIRLLLGLPGWGIVALLKIVAAGMAAWWFARELDVPHRQAIVSGIVYATAGYTIVWLLYPITQVFVFIPALAAAALRLMKMPAIRNAALVILFAALATAGGHPETLLISVIGIWIFLCWEAEKRRDLGLLSVIPATIGAALGFLLLGVQLVPFFWTVGDSYAAVLRPGMPHPFRIWGALSQFLPGILGTPLRGELDLTALPNAENFNVRAGGYIGALVLLALLLAWRELSPSLRRGLVIGVVALVISWYPPGLWPIARNLPLIRVLSLEYTVSLFVLFGAMAAGPAIAIAASRRRRKVAPLLVAAGLLAVIAGLFPAIPASRAIVEREARHGIELLRARGHLRQAPEIYEQRLGHYLSAAGMTAVRRLAVPGACWLLAGIALLVPMRRRAALFGIAAVGELVSFGVGLNPAVPMTQLLPEPPVLAAVHRLDPAQQYMIAAHFEILPANLATLYGVRDVVSYDALNQRARVEQLIPGGYNPLLHSINPILATTEPPVLAGAGVRYILSRTEVAGTRRVAGPAAPAVGVYEVPGAQPTAIPTNRRPAGLAIGAAVSLLAFLASAVWLRLYLLPAPVPNAVTPP